MLRSTLADRLFTTCAKVRVMNSRVLPAVLGVLLLSLQGQLWLGRGSISNVSSLRTELRDQQLLNVQAIQTNARLEAEILDLQEGIHMVEYRARAELGMLKPNEIFVQIAK